MLWNFPFCLKNLADLSYKCSGFCCYLWQQYCGVHMNVFWVFLKITAGYRTYTVSIVYVIINKWTNRVFLLWICWCTWVGNGCLELEKTVPWILWQRWQASGLLSQESSAECSDTSLQQQRREMRVACWKQGGEFCWCSHSSCPGTFFEACEWFQTMNLASKMSYCPEQLSKE